MIASCGCGAEVEFSIGRQHQRRPVRPAPDKLGGEFRLGLGVFRMVSGEISAKFRDVLLQFTEDEVCRSFPQDAVDRRQLDAIVFVLFAEIDLAGGDRRPSPVGAGRASSRRRIEKHPRPQVNEGLADAVHKSEVLPAIGRVLESVDRTDFVRVFADLDMSDLHAKPTKKKIEKNSETFPFRRGALVEGGHVVPQLLPQ